MGCGKRGLPPSPDRWAPKLSGANAIDRNHLDLIFSERMDKAAAGQTGRYTVVDPTGDTLPVYSAQLLPDGQTVRLTTETQASLSYSVYVSMVTDVAGNELRPGSVKSFNGSTEEDKTRPRVRSIHPPDGSISVPLDSIVRITFSETMDTSSASLADGALLVFPPPADSSLSWNDDLSSLSLPVLALTSHKAFVHVTRGCRDYGGNRLIRHERSIFTTLDSLPGGIIRGRVRADERLTPLLTPIGVFDSLWAPLLLDYAGDTTGSFAFTHLEDGEYRLAAATDQDGDGILDLRGVSDQLAVQGGAAIEGVEVTISRDGMLPGGIQGIIERFYMMSAERDEYD